MGSINVTIDYKALYDEIMTELTKVKEKYNKLVEEFEALKEERDNWKQMYIDTDKVLQLMSENPVPAPGPTPSENRRIQNNFQGQWKESIDSNFDIFS